MAIVLSGTTNDILVNGVSVATDTEVSSAVAPLATKVDTSAFTGSNQSLAASGYQKLPGGLIIQWLEVGFPSGGNQTVTVSFPIAFPNKCLIAVVGVGENGTNVDDKPVRWVANQTTKSIIAINCYNAYANFTGAEVLAIGY